MKGLAVVGLISAAWIRYNANTRNSNVGDCAKRALAVAYSMDYDEVSRELNRIKRHLGASDYNITLVIRAFMAVRGDTMKKLATEDRMTEVEFCASHPTGVYVAFSAKEKDRHSTHMVAIVDGDVYDSWDSRGWYIYEYAKVSTGKSDRYEVTFEDVELELDAFVESYVDKLNKTANLGYNIGTSTMTRLDNYTGRFTVVVYLNGEAPAKSKYSRLESIGHRITIKLNPRLSEEENLKSLKSKLKQKIYDWIYEVRKELKNSSEMEKIAFNPSIFRTATKKFIMNLPEWSRELVREVSESPGGSDPSYSDKYTVYMDPLEGDPRLSEVKFAADTLRELKDQMEMYRESYARLDYDY